MENKKTIPWISCAKFMAIFGVLISHSWRILKINEEYVWGVTYCVSLFILISGLLSYRSNVHHNYTYIQSIVHSLKKIIIAYLIATFICQAWSYKTFDFIRYVKGLIAFPGPFYYVFLYIHLMLVSKVLYNLIAFKTRICLLKDLTVGYCVIVISYISTNYSNILNVFGGGGRLFGGTYLFLFYLGMIFEKYKIFERITIVKSLLAMTIGGAVYLGFWIFACNDRLKLDGLVHFGGFNPPGITFMSLSLGMIFLCYGLFNIINRIKPLSFVIRFVSFLGSHTLYIFLYHKFFLDYILRPYVQISDDYARFMVYICVMTGSSIFLEFFIGCLVKSYCHISQKVKDSHCIVNSIHTADIQAAEERS